MNPTNDRLLVPVVDISGWEDGDGETRDRIAQQVDGACRTIGFMQITGHGVDDVLRAEFTNAMDELFALPADVKQRFRPPRPSINRGYTPPKSERLSYSLGVDSPADMFEAFNVGASIDEYPGRDPEIYARNIWPDADAAPSVRPGVEAWFREVGGLARRMTEIMARALGLRPDYFRSFTDESIDVLRMVNYALPEGIPLEPDQLGMGAHTDYGIVTILWADAVPGLEILGPDGTWHGVQPAAGAFLVNLGDLLERWTNDRYTSTMHRVVPPTDGDGRSIRRRSAAFFHDGNSDALVSTIESCRDADGGSSYDDVTVGEHLARKLGGSRGLELNPHADREAARIASRTEAAT